MMNSQISSKQAAQELLKRRKARNSLTAFTKYTFPEFEEARHHYLIAEALERVEQKVAARQGARLMIFLPPRHTKSEFASRRFPAWCIGRHPKWQFINTTYSSEFSADFGREVRNMIASQPYQALFPGTQLSVDSKSANRWNTSAGGAYVAAGVNGPLTGRGAHILMIDDPFKDYIEAYSPKIRKSIWKWYVSVARTRLMPGAGIVLVMTRWHDDDLAGRLIKKMDEGTGEKWDIVSLPGLIETPGQAAVDPLGRQVGDALWPEWYDAEYMEGTKNVMPSFQWSALYQQEPVPEEGNLFERDWFQWYDKIPEHGSYYMTFDGAVTDETETDAQDPDYTEIGVWFIDQHKDIYAVDWWYGRVTMDKWINVLLNLLSIWPKTLFLISEVGTVRRACEPFLKDKMDETGIYAVRKWLPHVGDKTANCAAFRGLASMGRIHLPNGKQWAIRLLNQLLRFPAGSHDDGVDCCGFIGRALNLLHVDHLPKPKQPSDIHRKPTLAELLEDDDRYTEYIEPRL